MPPAEKDRPGKVFVGGMSTETIEATIEDQFSKFGKINEVILVRNKETNVSRGFGFITFDNPSDAATAVKEMNGVVLDGKTLKVDSALKALHSHDSGRGRGGRGGGQMGRGGPRGGFGGRGHPPPLMRRGLSGPHRGPPRGGPPRGGSSRGRGGLLGDGRSMMMRGRGGPASGPPRSNGPRPSGPGLNSRPLVPSLLDRDHEMRPSRQSRGGYEDNYGPSQRPGIERALLSTPRHYEEDEYGPPIKRSRQEPSYPDQPADDYPPARGGYGQEENGYGGRPAAREYGDTRAELPPRDPVQARDSVLGRAPRYDYGDSRPELATSRERLVREPAVARGYPAVREAPRDYPPRERDPYASRGSYSEPTAERDPYTSARREPPTAARGYAASPYEERDYPPRTDPYDRSAPSYNREFSAETRPARPTRPAYADPYADPASAKDYGTQARGRANASYSTPRDSFTEPRAERPRMDYGARDPFSASAEPARGGRRAPPVSRGFERY